jgi:hypothetical protein
MENVKHKLSYTGSGFQIHIGRRGKALGFVYKAVENLTAGTGNMPSYACRYRSGGRGSA